jgi:hypothetical protein
LDSGQFFGSALWPILFSEDLLGKEANVNIFLFTSNEELIFLGV